MVDHQKFIEIWELLVRATHYFLTEEGLKDIKPLILEQYLNTANLKCAKINEGEIIAFCGVHHSKIGMLFISPDARGKGVGSSLVSYVIRN